MTGEALATDIRFCARCGGGLERVIVVAGEPERLGCVACSRITYLNPRVAAGALFLHDNGIVLVRRAIEPGRGLWTYPGGFVDLGETVQAAAVREAREETGLRISLISILDAYSYAESDVVVVAYSADVVGGARRAGPECLEVASFAPEALPWEELAFPSAHAALRDYVRRFFPRARLAR
jgi:ADP-ribose pyrophosphatase YjhB (NUDIX family)